MALGAGAGGWLMGTGLIISGDSSCGRWETHTCRTLTHHCKPMHNIKTPVAGIQHLFTGHKGIKAFQNIKVISAVY